MWIKRNKEGKLVLFSDKPESNDCENLKSEDNISIQIVLSDELAEKYSLNDVTCEDGFVEVSLNRICSDCEDSDYSYIGMFDFEKECSYPAKQPDNFYLNKSTYNDSYFKIIKKFAYNNYVIINFEYYNKDSGDVNIYRLYIDSVATLEHLWNNDLKKIYSDETESIDDEISEDSKVCCLKECETDETNQDVPEAESEKPERKSFKSLDDIHNDDVVTTVDWTIQIEALKIKFCGYIHEGETPDETDYIVGNCLTKVQDITYVKSEEEFLNFYKNGK